LLSTPDEVQRYTPAIQTRKEQSTNVRPATVRNFESDRQQRVSSEKEEGKRKRKTSFFSEVQKLPEATKSKRYARPARDNGAFTGSESEVQVAYD